MTDARVPVLAAFYCTHGFTENDVALAVQALALVDAADREQGQHRVPLSTVLQLLDVTVAAHAVLAGEK